MPAPTVVFPSEEIGFCLASIRKTQEVATGVVMPTAVTLLLCHGFYCPRCRPPITPLGKSSILPVCIFRYSCHHTTLPI